MPIKLTPRTLAVTGSIDGGATRVAGWSAADVAVAIDSVDNATGTYSGGPTIQIVTVSTSFLDPSLGFLSLLGLKAPTIAASHQERLLVARLRDRASRDATIAICVLTKPERSLPNLRYYCRSS